MPPRRDPLQAHQDRVRGMMRSFSEPFGRDPVPRLEEGRGHRHSQGGPSSSPALRQDHMVRGRGLCRKGVCLTWVGFRGGVVIIT